MNTNYFFLASSFVSTGFLALATLLFSAPVQAQEKIGSGSNSIFISNAKVKDNTATTSFFRLGNGNMSSATGACGKGAVEASIDEVYGQLNTFTFADDMVLAPLENFYLEEMEIIFLLDYDKQAEEIFLDFYKNRTTGGPGDSFPVSLAGAQVNLEKLGEHGNTIKDIMLITVTFPNPIFFPGTDDGTSYWAGVRITHNGTQNSAAAIGTSTMSSSQTFYVNRSGSWEKNTNAYTGVPQQDLLFGFYGNCETFLSVSDQEKLAEMSLYPNPMTGDSFFMDAEKLMGEQVDIRVSDITGRSVFGNSLILQQTQTEVDFGKGMSPGIYFVTIKVGGVQNTFRMVKK